MEKATKIAWSICALMTLCFPTALTAATYLYAGAPYTSTTNYTIPCEGGPCANFALGQKISGQFTTSVPLVPNLVMYNVYPSVTSYLFTDGINSYSSDSPNTRVVFLNISTDAAANITLAQVVIELWQTGFNPHAPNDRISFLQIFYPNIADTAVNNGICSTLGTSIAGVPNSCIAILTSDPSTSAATGLTSGAWSISLAQCQPITTLSDVGLLLLASLLAAFAVREIRTRAHYRRLTRRSTRTSTGGHSARRRSPVS